MSSAHRHQILLVDDYPLGRKLVALQLRRAGFDVTTASTAEEALEIARRAPPDAILSDIRMTGMDGFELAEAIRNDSSLSHIPVLLLSSALEEHERQRARDLGITCLLRTSDLGEALDTLEAALRDRTPRPRLL